MSDYKNLVAISRQKLLKALIHLEYSYQKIQTLPLNAAEMDEESLETWESFSARFARVSDIFLTRYLRAYILNQDPGFTGTFRDFVNQGEKLGLIDNSRQWMSIRELRNITAHDYSESELTKFFERLRTETPLLLNLKAKLNAPNSK